MHVLAVVAALLAFAALALVVVVAGGGADGLPGLDRPVLEAVHTVASPLLDRVMIDVSFIGAARFLVPACTLVTLLLGWRRSWREALFFALAGAGAWGLNIWIKSLVQRPRPSLWTSPQPETGFSFPSGHAMATSAIALALVFVAPPRWRPAATVAAVLAVGLIGLSRLYLGVHFPSDVLAGWCAGAAWSAGLAAATLRVSEA